MSKIYWDTMVFVYWLEAHPIYSKRVRQILTKMQERRDNLLASAFTVAEVLVGPYKAGALDAARKTREFFQSSVVEVIPFDLTTADLYAQIRAAHGVSAPDAIHLACASRHGTDIFLTNDAKLVGRVVPGIQFIVGLDSNLF